MSKDITLQANLSQPFTHHSLSKRAAQRVFVPCSVVVCAVQAGLGPVRISGAALT